MTKENENNNHRRFVFGNERFGGSYTPGEFEFNFPDDMSRDEFEKIFKSRMEFLHKRGNEFAEEFFDASSKSKKDKLKTLSIRVKPHTKEFFKNNSILSPRDVLEMYENFNNGSEAFINSLIEDEKQLEKQLKEVQEKLHNAKLFKDKLNEIEPDKSVLTDEDKMAKLGVLYENSEIKAIGNETSSNQVKNEIISKIQMYNTLRVQIFNNEVIVFTVYTNAMPVVYYFKNEYALDDISEIVKHIEEFCSTKEISFDNSEKDIFE